MSKGNILIECLASLMIVVFMIQMSLISYQRFNSDEEVNSLNNQINKECNVLCVLEKDLR